MSEANEQPQSPEPENNPPATPPTDESKSLIGEPPAAEADPEPEADPAPEPLTAEALTLPEGFEADEATLSSFVETINNADLTPQERAENLLALHAQMQETTATQMHDAWTQTQEQWRTEVQSLPEIGGQNLDQTLGSIAQVVDRYGGAEAREAFDLTGAGNHPAIIKLMASIAKDLNEAPPVSGAPPAGEPKSRAERMFGG